MLQLFIDGPVALDVIVRTYAHKLAETWPGDEALIGLVLRQRAGNAERTGIAWVGRERVLADLSRRRDGEQDPVKLARLEDAIAAVGRPRVPGKVMVIVSGWGDLRAAELDAADLRVGRRLTTCHVGSA